MINSSIVKFLVLGFYNMKLPSFFLFHTSLNFYCFFLPNQRHVQKRGTQQFIFQLKVNFKKGIGVPLFCFFGLVKNNEKFPSFVHILHLGTHKDTKYKYCKIKSSICLGF